VNSTPIVEEIQQPQAEAMKVDTPVAAQEPQNEKAKTQKEVQPESTEAALKLTEWHRIWKQQCNQTSLK
jgi:hypothetical protein